MKKISLIVIIFLLSLTSSYAIVNNKNTKPNITSIANYIKINVNSLWINDTTKIKYYEYLIKTINEQIKTIKNKKYKPND